MEYFISLCLSTIKGLQARLRPDFMLHAPQSEDALWEKLRSDRLLKEFEAFMPRSPSVLMSPFF